MRRHIKNYYKALISIIYRLWYWTMLYIPVFKFYQPIYGAIQSKDMTRECDDRWKVMGPILLENKGAVLDIGCNLGYFSFKAEAGGCFAYGMEASDFNVTCCNAIKSVSKAKNILFLKGMIDPEFAEKMPHFESILNLSVFHHWVKAFGAEGAQEMMKNMSKKCNTLIFETGQSDEIGSQWPKHLSFMGDDPKGWIENFLKECGFKDIKVIGTFSTGLTKTDRYLFHASK